MEELKSCRICEISVVCMSTQEFVGICRVFEGQIGCEVPKAT